jgi:hypothetical protein
MPLNYSENTPNKKTIGDKEYYYNQQKYNQTYYEKNKDKLLTKTECTICGKFVRKSGLSSHKKSKFCQFASKFIKPAEN